MCRRTYSKFWEEFRVDIDVLVTGLGYVGLPLAYEASMARLKVKGLDLSTQAVATLNSGRSHVDDIADSDVAAMLARGFQTTSNEPDIEQPNTIVICVPTPLSPEGASDLEAVRSAATAAGRVLLPVRQVTDLSNQLKLADLVVLQQAHDQYDLDLIARESRLVLDTSGRMTGTHVLRL